MSRAVASGIVGRAIELVKLRSVADSLRLHLEATADVLLSMPGSLPRSERERSGLADAAHEENEPRILVYDEEEEWMVRPELGWFRRRTTTPHHNDGRCR